jgi:hypothetical protein
VDGVVVGTYLSLADPTLAKIEHVLAHSRPDVKIRTGGLPGNRILFGALPRTQVRNDFCRFSENTTNFADQMPYVTAIAGEVAALYRTHLPDAYAAHMDLAAQIDSAWRFAGTPFCTCNFNYNFAIPYHRDAGNQQGVFSNVFIARKGVLGGQLVLPEFGVALAMRNGHLVVFSGTRVIHGVTPIVRLTGAKLAYRCSIVLYTMAGMEKCLCPEAEMERCRNARMKIEERWRIDRGSE